MYLKGEIMEKIKFLTQQRCPKCEQLRSFLELGLRNKYQDDIVEIKREVQRQEFAQLVHNHHLTQTPVLIYKDQVLTETTPTKVSAFLKEATGK